jgi:hypothetical protein
VPSGIVAASFTNEKKKSKLVLAVLCLLCYGPQTWIATSSAHPLHVTHSQLKVCTNEKKDEVEITQNCE